MFKPVVVGACATAVCAANLLTMTSAQAGKPDVRPTKEGLRVPARLVDRKVTVHTTYSTGRTTTRRLTLSKTLRVPHLTQAESIKVSSLSGRVLLTYKPEKADECTDDQPHTDNPEDPTYDDSPDTDEDEYEDEYEDENEDDGEEVTRLSKSRSKTEDRSGKHHRVVRFPAKATPDCTPTTPDPGTTPTPPSSATGEFLGKATNPGYGPIQVSITVNNGHIDTVTAVQYPKDLPKSARINSEAIPVLQAAALTAQSAQITTVSGATYTSKGFRTSLQSALTKAGL